MSDEGLEDEWRLFHVWRVEFSYVKLRVERASGVYMFLWRWKKLDLVHSDVDGCGLRLYCNIICASHAIFA